MEGTRKRVAKCKWVWHLCGGDRGILECEGAWRMCTCGKEPMRSVCGKEREGEGGGGLGLVPHLLI